MSFVCRRSVQTALVQNVASFFNPPIHLNADGLEIPGTPILDNNDTHLQVMGLNGTTYVKWGTVAVTTLNFDVIVLSTANTQIIAIPQWANSVSIMNNNAAPSVLLHWGRDR